MPTPPPYFGGDDGDDGDTYSIGGSPSKQKNRFRETSVDSLEDFEAGNHPVEYYKGTV